MSDGGVILSRQFSSHYFLIVHHTSAKYHDTTYLLCCRTIETAIHPLSTFLHFSESAALYCIIITSVACVPPA
jgi:hypothetical protein